jgi:hypothetical protein
MTDKKPPRSERFRANSQMISLRLPLKVLGAIDAAADESGVSRSEIISSALHEWAVAYKYLEPEPQLLLEKVLGSKSSSSK